MKGKPEVLAQLSKALKEELGALNQYMLHAEMCSNWGYKKLYAATKKEAMSEMQHAEKLIERIIFLEGTPKLQDLPKLNIGTDIPQQLANDLELELSAVKLYNEAIEAARKAGDNATADLFSAILKDEEEHVGSLEMELGLIEKIGLQNYLAQQLKE